MLADALQQLYPSGSTQSFDVGSPSGPWSFWFFCEIEFPLRQVLCPVIAHACALLLVKFAPQSMIMREIGC